MEEPMSWKTFLLKRIVVISVALMLILLSASGCTPENGESDVLQSAGVNTVVAPTGDAETLAPSEMGGTSDQTEKSTASETDVVWTPFV